MSANIKIKDWSGKTVWVIGASAGIGAAFARDVAKAGGKVIASARGVDALNRFAASVPNTAAVAFDFSDATACARAWETITAQFGVPDVVVMNAGTYVPMLSTKFDRQGAQQQFEVNLGGPLNVLSHVLPAYTAQGKGHIVLVSSVAGYRGLPRALAYGASKAALTYIAQCLYIDLAQRGIGVSVVCPGFVKTDLTAGNRFAMPALQTPEQASTAILKGLARGEFEIHFPKRFSLFLKLLGLLPFTWYAALLNKIM